MKKNAFQSAFIWRTMKNSLLANMYFFGQFLRSPAFTGSICPSSHFLAQELVTMAIEDKGKRGLIVDLGAGSGVVSHELLKRGIAADNILAVDISQHCQEIFSRHCPGIRLHIGDARNLIKIIARYYPGERIRAVISSLPLRSLPTKNVYEIMRALWRLLRKGGILVQFTYALWQHCALEQYGFLPLGRQYVPLNLPPALIEKYRANI